MQTLKIINTGEKKLKGKMKHQAQLIDNLLLANSINARLLKEIAIPELFEHHTDEIISRMHASGLSLTELINFGIDRNIIAHYELVYYIGKAKEQQELLSAPKLLNEDVLNSQVSLKHTSQSISNTKEINDEEHSYSLRPVSA